MVALASTHRLPCTVSNSYIARSIQRVLSPSSTHEWQQPFNIQAVDAGLGDGMADVAGATLGVSHL